MQGRIKSCSFLLLENKSVWVCSSFLEAHVKPVERKRLELSERDLNSSLEYKDQKIA